jgi:hypothetical protein
MFRYSKIVLVLLFLVGSRPLVAQETHVEQLQLSAIDCLGAVPSVFDQFLLHPPEQAPYIRSALINYWTEQDKKVFLSDSTRSTSALPSLEYSVDRIGVDLGKTKSGQVPRTVHLAIRYLLAGPDSQVLADSHCDTTLSDTLSVEMARRFQDARFSETDVQPSEKNWLNEYLQPAVLIGAAAVGTFLLFNLRTTQSGGGQ